MALDPRQLRAFLAIVRCGSLGLAAESLHITQPALSRIVRRLEDQLGVPLFERRTTGMEPTAFGQALLPHVTVLPHVLERMLTQWPNLHVQITEGVEDALEVALNHNTIDVAISGPIPES